MRALSDALPTGHRAMTNPTLQLHFGCGRATPPVSHSHNWPSRRMQNFLFKIGQKSYFFANKDPQTNFDDWMILQKHVLSFQCNTFFKMANLKAISSSATLTLVQARAWCQQQQASAWTNGNQNLSSSKWHLEHTFILPSSTRPSKVCKNPTILLNLSWNTLFSRIDRCVKHLTVDRTTGSTFVGVYVRCKQCEFKRNLLKTLSMYINTHRL